MGISEARPRGFFVIKIEGEKKGCVFCIAASRKAGQQRQGGRLAALACLAHCGLAGPRWVWVCIMWDLKQRPADNNQPDAATTPVAQLPQD